MTKIFTAKSVDVPANVFEQLDQILVGKGQNLSDILADMGRIRDKSAYAMAIGLAKSLQGLIGAYSEVTGKKFNLEGFSTIMSGLMISYVLGYGRWEKDIPVYMPETINPSELFSYDFIKLRSGREISVDDLMARIMQLTSEEQLKQVFNEISAKTILGNRKEISPFDSVNVLMAMISLSDEI